MSRRATIVVPCFNEVSRIDGTIAVLREWFPQATEILVIDDGSTDGTGARAMAHAAGIPDVRVHVLPRNRGKGAAVRAAIPLATGDLVVLLDADLAFDRESVAAVLCGLEHADMVIGNRRHHASRYLVPVRLFGFLYRRHVAGMTFNLLIRALLRLTSRDTQCGLKGFRIEALQRIGRSLTIDGFAVDVEMLLVARALGLRIADVPVTVTYESAMSSVRLVRSAAAMSTDILRLFLGRATAKYRADRVRDVASRTPPPAPVQGSPPPPR